MRETILCGQKLKSPLILGSGPLGEKKESLIAALNAGAGAVVNRSLRVDNTRRQVFSPAYYIEDNYMLNADNNNKTPWNYWVENAEAVEAHGPLIISISARNPRDSGIIVSAFEGCYSPSFYELNFSCSHSAKLYGRITEDNVKEALTSIREKTDKPLFLKLSADNMNFNRLEELETGNLLDGYVLSNTIGPGLKIDIKTGRSVIGSVLGGVSGPAIKPLVLAAILELNKFTEKPVIGVGGIESAEDVLEYLILGCAAVQIYTRAHRNGIKVFTGINNRLRELLRKMNETVESIKNTFESDTGAKKRDGAHKCRSIGGE